MPFENIIQPKIIVIDEKLRLISVIEEDWNLAIPWYKNPKVLYYSEGIEDKVYDFEVIKRMYSYLESIGELYFIQINDGGKWTTIGDVTLSEENLPIVIGDEKYWGKGFGKKVIEKLLKRAKEIHLKKIYIPLIYKYNERSRNLFESLGFEKVKESEEAQSFQLNL